MFGRGTLRTHELYTQAQNYCGSHLPGHSFNGRECSTCGAMQDVTQLENDELERLDKEKQELSDSQAAINQE